MFRKSVFGFLAFLVGSPVSADISSSGSNNLGTKINGQVGGTCNSGSCEITGGTLSGINLFHRFSSFDTRGDIEKVNFEIGSQNNVIVGVTAPTGSFINKPISLSSQANLYWVSPGGIRTGPGTDFINVSHLTLTTATSLNFSSDGVFDVFGNTSMHLPSVSSDPLPGSLGLINDPDQRKANGITGTPKILLEGIDITVDKSLLVDAPDGTVEVINSRLIATSADNVAGSITITGDEVRIDGDSQLLATGNEQGGLIQIGGSWQNSNPTVREAIKTTIEYGAFLDASAIYNGDGGTIVAWSDITNLLSMTFVSGTLKARGGEYGGRGGRIETSGFVLEIAGIDVDASATAGENGLWLLDPYDYTIDSIEADYIVDALGDQINVTISTASSTSTAGGNTITAASGDDPDGGTITVDAEIDLMCPSGPCGDLTLTADKDIQINALVGGEGFEQSNLTLSSKTGVSINSGGSIQWLCEFDCGQVEISSSVSGGLTGSGPLDMGSSSSQSLIVNQVGTSEFSGKVSGTSGLQKNGTGTLRLTGNSNDYTGATTVNAGVLQVNGNVNNNSNVSIASGARYIISASQPQTYSGVISGAGVFRKEGSGTLTLSGASTHSGNTEVGAGLLLVTGSLSDSTVVDVSSGATYTLGSSDTIGGIEGAGSVNLNSNELTVNQSATEATFSGIISGSTATSHLTKAGSGTLILAGNNTYQGTTSVNAGVLKV
ncbi:MAG: autotransporter-associated beta strand repeat-containing protein, partial [SAR324 cluster bacterium]|nr:autotransporter-associated beta strand repeat-containing protein [SAR324 cluster bacterium]